MLKHKKAVLVSIVILIQSALAISAGVAAIYLTAGSALPPGIYAGNVDIGGIHAAEAEKRIDGYYAGVFGKGSLQIAVDDGSKYDIAFADIEASVDSSATVESIYDLRTLRYLPNLIKAYFSHEKVVFQPVVKFNEGRLRQKLIALSQQMDKEPVNATVYIDNGKLSKKADTSGWALNIGNAVEVIRQGISKSPGTPVKFSTSKNFEISTVNAKIKLKDLDDIEQVIADYSTEIIEPELLNSIRLASGAINGIILPAEKSGAGEAGIFSFVNWLKKQDTDFENDNEGYDQVASTLYAALLNAGIRKDAITRLPHKLAVGYIDPGLDAWISGGAGDLKFINTFAHKLAVFAEVSNNKLTVRLAGNLQDKKTAYVLKVDVVQKFDPPVVNVESKDLKPGEKVMLSPGKEGVIVNVYRNQELISTDKYEAEKTMVQVGPKTDWSEDNEK